MGPLDTRKLAARFGHAVADTSSPTIGATPALGQQSCKIRALKSPWPWLAAQQ
jgi:hypothetical protein